MSQDITATDLFCGAGGSSQGLHAAGVNVAMASNHWRLAVDSHNANFPGTRHDCADISQVDPRRYPRTDILWGSPSCTKHSSANTNKAAQSEVGPVDGELVPPLPEDAEQRSRATMWDIVRFAEYHQYRSVVVENVVDVAKWVLFEPWLQSMHRLGYDHKLISLNSMFAGGEGHKAAAQSRDRLYVAFWRNGDIAPDFGFTPSAFCAPCGADVAAVQTFKRPDVTFGKYRRQYVYSCPTCSTVVEPYSLSAASIIDWSVPSQRIGDREKPLADKTMARISAGLEKYGKDLLVPVEGRDGKVAQPIDVVMRTQTARNETGFLSMPFMTELRGGGSHKVQRPVTEPLSTVTASGNHHGLVIPDGAVKVDDCSFRMLQPHEVGAAMAFDSGYKVLGSKREQVRMYGNAVTPPAAQLIVSRAVEALAGARQLVAA
jgi:DNA (cytosine-5)-methyltransferase 1